MLLRSHIRSFTLLFPLLVGTNVLISSNTYAASGRAAMDSPDEAAIPNEGAFHSLPNAAYQPQKDQTYKIVFALTKAPDSPSDINPALERVARSVNLYASAGVPLSHMKFVAVASGLATAAMLDNEHYKIKFHTDNPNLELIKKLRAVGVDVAVCGQAVAESKYEFSWISKDVTLALSALTTVTVLQQQGYALMPL